MHEGFENTPPPAEESFDEEKYRQEFEPEVEQAVHALTKRFCEKTGIIIADEELPKVFFIPNRRTPYGIIKTQIPTSHSHRAGVITITEDNIDNKDAVTEEISHFIRGKLRPAGDKDTNVEEFFGYLGRRILFPNLERKLPFDSDEEYEEYKLGIEQKLANPDISVEERVRLNTELVNTADHYEGYKYASLVDLEKINNWKEVFSLSGEEVRKRFFHDS